MEATVAVLAWSPRLASKAPQACGLGRPVRCLGAKYGIVVAALHCPCRPYRPVYRLSAATSQRMFASLKAKRFRQIFEYLDEEGAGSLDLLAVLGRSPANADPQVGLGSGVAPVYGMRTEHWAARCTGT